MITIKEQRDTIQRSLVLEAVKELHNHPTAEDVYLHVSKKYPSISKGTVYRNLHCLADDGKISKVSIDNIARFDYNISSHYHLKCSKCGRIYDYYPEEPLKISNVEFKVESIEVVINGICKVCQENH